MASEEARVLSAYVAKHRPRLEEACRDALLETLRRQPDDPLTFMAAQMQQLALASREANFDNAAPEVDALHTQSTSAPQRASQPQRCDIPAEAAAAELLDALHAGAATAVRPTRPVHSHDRRLPSGERGLSRAALSGLRSFYERMGGLDKLMADVCKEDGFGASVCALTRATGLSLAETIVIEAEARSGAHGESSAGTAIGAATGTPAGAPVDAPDDFPVEAPVDVPNLLVGVLIGEATTFFSYSWTGTRLGDMLWALETKLAALEAADGVVRYVWVDMFAASQNLLAGEFLPNGREARELLKASDPEAYKACKEDTDRIFADALRPVRELLLYAFPLVGEWDAPPHPFLLAERGEAPAAGWKRQGPAAITRAWCLYELVQALAKRATLHVVLARADVDRFEEVLVDDFDAIAHAVAGVDARDAQISKEEDREYIMQRVAELEGGLGGVNASVCAALRVWLAEEGRAALDRLPAGQRRTSPLMGMLGRLLQAQGDLDGAAVLLREALEARRETLGDRHPHTLTSINNLGLLLQAQGDLDGAAVLLAELDG